MNEMVQLLGAAGLGGVIAAILNAIVNRRKLSAEATEIITKAAAGTVANVVSDNQALRVEVGELRRRVDEFAESGRIHEQRERAWQNHDQQYRWHLERWSRYAASLLTDLLARGGRPTEEPPSLYPELHP